MDVSAPTARVNGAQLAQQVGKKVRFVCKTESVEGNLMRVLAADNMPVTVQLAGSGSYDTSFLEFEGIVENPSTVREIVHTNFGNAFGECARTLPKAGAATTRAGCRDNPSRVHVPAKLALYIHVYLAICTGEEPCTVVYLRVPVP
eukprot:5640655-Pyramimonas_sp.AAC.2